MPSIKLQSSDGQLFTADVTVARHSGTIRIMLEDLGVLDGQIEDATTQDIVLPVPNVNSAILRKVLQWTNYHRDPQEANQEADQSKESRTDDIGSWDADFFKVDQGLLFEIILAANDLDIRGLLDVGCKTVANMIKGKSLDEVRKTFRIRNDFTPEEEQQIRSENEWCEEK